MTLHGPECLPGGRVRFSVWAPRANEVVLALEDGRRISLAAGKYGYHSVVVSEAGPGTLYRYLLDGKGPYPDPASRSQPSGVEGPSCVVDLPKPSCTSWRGIPLSSYVICEIHVGTFSDRSSFAAIEDELEWLSKAGYSAIELMPVGEFPGSRNWGYDGVFPFAAQSTYGGPYGLASLVAAAHQRSIAVVLDVVYNHIGPESSALEHYGPYLSGSYSTPWGQPPNLDGPGSDAVRAFFIENACYWVKEVGVDGLRLDAVHAIIDPTASPFLSELSRTIHALGRHLGRIVTVVGESSANDPLLSKPVEAGGTGLDGQWNDDFHHAAHVAVTNDRSRWFADYDGLADLAKAVRHGFVMEGRYSIPRGRRHGLPSPTPPGDSLVIFAQNHDQIGNAGLGNRLTSIVDLQAQFPLAALLLLSPFVPLRFMGEEYGETAPFAYFTSHTDPDLIRAVRQGRAAEVGSDSELQLLENLDRSAWLTAMLDPQDPSTFTRCIPDRSLSSSGVHSELLKWQRDLCRLRQSLPCLGSLEPARTQTAIDPNIGAITIRRAAEPYLDAVEVVIVCVLSPKEAVISSPLIAGNDLVVLLCHGAGGLTQGAVLPGTEMQLGPWGVAVLEASSRGDRR